ncbi:hypothetical protein ACSYAD_27725 [Acaryochloris marina NIES-2412]|uniref:hypothetical protein n=1 Tax=Acaryochloris marina TaxID=155978 RepID=UPI0040588724
MHILIINSSILLMLKHQKISSTIQDQLSVQSLQDGQLRSIVNHQHMGVILQKKYYAEYIGPGAAIGGHLDMECVNIYVLGEVEYDVPENNEKRYGAFQKRIKNIEQLQEICEISSPIYRGIAVLEMLIQQFSLEEIQRVPNNLLAMLVGVVPATIAAAWQKLLAKQGNVEGSPSIQLSGMPLNNVISFQI